jgi:hypothetical protein
MTTKPVLLHNCKRAKKEESSTFPTPKAIMHADKEHKLGQDR